jgi:hypothetical protein
MNLKDITQYVSDLSDKQRNKYQFLIIEKIISFNEQIDIEKNKIDLYKKKIEEIYFNIANNINNDLDINVLLNYNNQISNYKRKITARLNKTIEIQKEIDFLNDILDIINFKENSIVEFNPKFDWFSQTEISLDKPKFSWVDETQRIANKPKRKQQEIIDELKTLGVVKNIIIGNVDSWLEYSFNNMFKKCNPRYNEFNYTYFYISKTHLDKGLDHVEKIYALLWELIQHNAFNTFLDDNSILCCVNTFVSCLRNGVIHVYINDNDPLSPYVFHKESQRYLNRKGISILN